MSYTYRNIHPYIRGIIKKVTGSYNEDIEQEVYLKALENKEKYHEEGKLVAWLKTIAQNVAKDYFKSAYFKSMNQKADVEESALQDNKSVSALELQLQKERQKAILKAVDSLPSKMREVVNLYEFEELSYEEISKKLGISLGTVKSRLFSAREILSEKLAYLKGE
ncbi:MAG: RNA polymerase sigma factor [Alphaproteobacteria bacterium]|nr:RNA polymerase sigma factor [Alphaproteobacteria bacterium]